MKIELSSAELAFLDYCLDEVSHFATSRDIIKACEELQGEIQNQTNNFTRANN